MAAAMSGFNAAYAASAGQQSPMTEPQRDLPDACIDTLPEDKKSFYNQNFLMFYPPYGTVTLLFAPLALLTREATLAISRY